MSRKALHDDWIFRASENITTNLKMEYKAYLLYASMIGSPIILSMIVYFTLKYMTYRELIVQRIAVQNFNWLDGSFLVYFALGIVLTYIMQILFGRKIYNYALEENKRILSDEYVRGAKFVCVDEFNHQFVDTADDEMIKIQIVEEKCNREF
jgi:predicted membrane protein